MRLIDADALLAAYDLEHEGPPGRARKLIEEAPDAVVRCKDCMYAHLTYDGECKYCDLDEDEDGFVEAAYRPGDWFCAGGERKEEQVAK